MSQTILEPETNQTAERDERLMAGLGYVLILLGNIIGVTTLIAVILAYARKDAAPGWLHSHYVFQIRTFWVAVIGILASSLLVATVILSPFGLLGFGLIWLWVLIRSVIGLIRLIDRRGNADPQGYWV